MCVVSGQTDMKIKLERENWSRTLFISSGYKQVSFTAGSTGTNRLQLLWHFPNQRKAENQKVMIKDNTVTRVII